MTGAFVSSVLAPGRGAGASREAAKRASSEVPPVSKVWGTLAPNVALRVASGGARDGHFGVTEGVMEFGTESL